MTESKLRRLVNFFTILATVIIFALMLLVLFQMINRSILSNKEAALKNELSSLTTQIDYIENQNENLEDENYLEQYAREYYGYGKEGEKQYSANI